MAVEWVSELVGWMAGWRGRVVGIKVMMGLGCWLEVTGGYVGRFKHVSVVGRVIVQEGFAHRVHVKPGNLEATAGLPLSLSVLSREGLAGVRFK